MSKLNRKKHFCRLNSDNLFKTRHKIQYLDQFFNKEMYFYIALNSVFCDEKIINMLMNKDMELLETEEGYY